MYVQTTLECHDDYPYLSGNVSVSVHDLYYDDHERDFDIGISLPEMPYGHGDVTWTSCFYS